MENFEDKSHLIDEAKQLDRKMQSKIDAGEAQNFSEAQELVTFDEVFGIDQQRDAEDIKRRIDDYFSEVARKYEPAMPIPDSIVRLNQETEIAETLRGDKPVLIRGNWRMGKTSMTRSLETHQFGRENSIIMDAMAESAGRGESLEDFQKHFGVYRIAQFIAEESFQAQNFKIDTKKKTRLENK